MHIALHIFKKDVRRLWVGIAIVLLVQAAAAWVDAVGATAVPAGMLLIVSWTTLLVLAVHEDPPVGDRQFWIARPARWRVLLGAKLLFAAAVVHVPLFVADIVVLAARGFRPWEWLARLLTDQLLAAAAVTLPAIALAAVLPNLAHLALAFIAIAGLSALAVNIAPLVSGNWAGMAETRDALAAGMAGAAAVAMIWWQFAHRRIWRSRLMGIAGGLSAVLTIAFLPPLLVARLRAAVHPAPAHISFHVRAASPNPVNPLAGMLYTQVLAGRAVMAVPLAIVGTPAGTEHLFALQTLDVIGPGEHFQLATAGYLSQDWLLVDLPLRFYRRMKDAKVELKGSAAAILYRVGSTASLPLGVDREVPGLGRCFSQVIDSPASGFIEPHSFLKVECESPDLSPLTGFVKLRESEGSAAHAQFGWPSGGGLVLRRTYTSFVLGPAENPRPSWRLEITPDIPQGSQVVDFDLRDLRLGDYVQRPNQ